MAMYWAVMKFRCTCSLVLHTGYKLVSFGVYCVNYRQIHVKGPPSIHIVSRGRCYDYSPYKSPGCGEVAINRGSTLIDLYSAISITSQ